MSAKHPVIAVTGSSGSGTTSAKEAFEQIFRSQGITPAMIEGDCFHRYNRSDMNAKVEEFEAQNKRMTHFGPEGNLFDELECVFMEYARQGTGRRRYYIHDEKEAVQHGFPIGSLTPWEDLPKNSDLLFYEGLHGGVVTDKVNAAQHVDLLVGVVPIINLEWIQKIHRDRLVRGYSAADATKMILGRMHDYVHYITPQFSLTDINFQRVPTVDTSNPFAAENIPTNDESFSVIQIHNLKKIVVNFHQLLEVLEGSFMSTPNTIVVPAAKNTLAMQLILTPAIARLIGKADNS